MSHTAVTVGDDGAITPAASEVDMDMLVSNLAKNAIKCENNQTYKLPVSVWCMYVVHAPCPSLSSLRFH